MNDTIDVGAIYEHGMKWKNDTFLPLSKVQMQLLEILMSDNQLSWTGQCIVNVK